MITCKNCDNAEPYGEVFYCAKLTDEVLYPRNQEILGEMDEEELLEVPPDFSCVYATEKKGN